LSKKQDASLIIFNNETWKFLKDHIVEIGIFLSTNKMTDNIIDCMVESVKLIISEFILNPQNYQKYSIKEYTADDFVDMIIEDISISVPNIDDYEENKEYIDNFRNIIWGYIKQYKNILPDILISMEDLEYVEDIEEPLNTDYSDICIKCLTVVWVECILRIREAHILEHIYGQ